MLLCLLFKWVFFLERWVVPFPNRVFVRFFYVFKADDILSADIFPDHAPGSMKAHGQSQGSGLVFTEFVLHWDLVRRSLPGVVVDCL